MKPLRGRKTAVALSLADDVRDDVLARLLALNAERYAEESPRAAQGRKSAATASGKKRGRPAETGSASSEQVG